MRRWDTTRTVKRPKAPMKRPKTPMDTPEGAAETPEGADETLEGADETSEDAEHVGHVHTVGVAQRQGRRLAGARKTRHAKGASPPRGERQGSGGGAATVAAGAAVGLGHELASRAESLRRSSAS